MRIGISGSRSITDEKWVYDNLDTILDPIAERGDKPVILSGGAKGVDDITVAYSAKRKYDHILFKPYHLVDTKEPYRAKFFFARNKQIVDNSDLVIIMWDGKSSGTRFTLEYAERMKPSKIIRLIYTKPYGMPE